MCLIKGIRCQLASGLRAAVQQTGHFVLSFPSPSEALEEATGSVPARPAAPGSGEETRRRRLPLQARGCSCTRRQFFYEMNASLPAEKQRYALVCRCCCISRRPSWCAESHTCKQAAVTQHFTATAGKKTAGVTATVLLALAVTAAQRSLFWKDVHSIVASSWTDAGVKRSLPAGERLMRRRRTNVSVVCPGSCDSDSQRTVPVYLILKALFFLQSAL